MPELPEVETCRSQIAPFLIGRKIGAVKLASRNYAFLSAPAAIRKAAVGAVVTAVRRHGKYLLVDLSPALAQAPTRCLLIHLGMTGQLFVTESAPTNHVHMQWSLEGVVQALVFRDPRKFGKLKLLVSGKEYEDERLARLGPDALTLTAERLYECSRKRRGSIKGLLLDQSMCAGIGNIYADEALFAAGIRPTRIAGILTRQDCERLACSVVAILHEAVAQGGSSISDYLKPDGTPGYFQRSHAVYGRDGEACRNCGSTVRKVIVAQRGTHYCPVCQKR